ncbi:MAG TPA: AAA family ATPase [Ktedonobacterales bacterium]
MNDTDMKLVRFRVTNFRSVEDSGWIEAGDVTALIGTNESGKTNILVPLWKLKPAKEGSINLLTDAPRKRYTEIRDMRNKPVFIEAIFELSEQLAAEVSDLTSTPVETVTVSRVTRDLGGNYTVGFPNARGPQPVSAVALADMLLAAYNEIYGLTPMKSEEALKPEVLNLLHRWEESARAIGNTLNKAELERLHADLAKVNIAEAPKRSLVVPAFARVLDSVELLLAQFAIPLPSTNADARQLILNHVPSFVYYSNYGNLDSEIYLPHVIENMKRTDLGPREEAKARTLRVLFDFVGLKPEEILQLGQEAIQPGQPVTEEQIETWARQKTEREILLQSASTKLTSEFRDWWKQGDYRIRMQADGNHFRIWVSDDKRPEEIELEGRSSGLQWFLSFYLIFLVESTEAHKGAILLLDEPGLSLHPIAQQDLSAFFDNLARTNQLLYTTHSPFLVDPNHLDRVRAVYVNDQGTTNASSNLRASEKRPAESRSVYPVHAALGLTVSSTLLLGCQPVVVEGPSDQIYLSAVKVALISHGRITPHRELVFMPGGSSKGIAALVTIVTAKDEDLPCVLLDSDEPGQRLATQLKRQAYQGAESRILHVGDFCGVVNAEIEDLFPSEFLAGIITRQFRGPEEDFSEVVISGKPIVPQVEAYAHKHDLQLVPGWKVEVAMRSKERLLRDLELAAEQPLIRGCLDMWALLFERLEAAASDRSMT